ncbi:MAG: type 4a pilus biogenesis protein PilO [Candidatus Magnetoovum sp. WYHC-5]|nr:type 4a pilus biogenesis protein PilO [Candidatus Magnetoovum sp. WYHC-5]
MKLDLQNPTIKIVLYILPVIIVAPLFFFAIYSPKTEEIKKLQAELVKMDGEIVQAKEKVKRLPTAKEKLQRAEARYNALKKFLPEENEISDLLKQVSDIGITSGLKINKWQPDKKRQYTAKGDKAKVLYEIPVNVVMEGSYHNMGTFLGRLTNLDRIVNISNLKLAQPKYKQVREDSPYSSARAERNEALLTIEFKGSTFSSAPETEQEQEFKPTKKKGR